MAQRLDSAIGHSSILSARFKADEPRSVVERTATTTAGKLSDQDLRPERRRHIHR
jgi:RNA:NAD 2'-phosphotransferase (TPT1/KptA family)